MRAENLILVILLSGLFGWLLWGLDPQCPPTAEGFAAWQAGECRNWRPEE